MARNSRPRPRSRTKDHTPCLLAGGSPARLNALEALRTAACPGTLYAHQLLVFPGPSMPCAGCTTVSPSTVVTGPLGLTCGGAARSTATLPTSAGVRRRRRRKKRHKFCIIATFPSDGVEDSCPHRVRTAQPLMLRGYTRRVCTTEHKLTSAISKCWDFTTPSGGPLVGGGFRAAAHPARGQQAPPPPRTSRPPRLSRGTDPRSAHARTVHWQN